MLTKVSIEEIKNILLANAGEFLDEQTGKRRKVDAFGVLVRGDEEIIFPIKDSQKYQIRQIRVIKGEPSLSTWSVSQVELPEPATPEQQQAFFNRKHIGSAIKEIIRIA